MPLFLRHNRLYGHRVAYHDGLQTRYRFEEVRRRKEAISRKLRSNAMDKPVRVIILNVRRKMIMNSAEFAKLLFVYVSDWKAIMTIQGY